MVNSAVLKELELKFYLSEVNMRVSTFPENAPKWLIERLSYFEAMFKKTGVGILRGQINCVAHDDDIDYTILNLHILENYGLNFKTINVGET